ncbi:MAG: phosphoribosylglycinamide formyltransferase [Ruminococcaceae bacterium]|nr:phosphoribosylglycinamide formyltransferase [Oscillospiraceae bacterium]
MKDKIKIAVLVSGGGTNLQALIDAQKAGIINSGRISLVVSNNINAYALERAKNEDIPSAVLLKSECGGQDAFEDRLIGLLKDNGIELIVLAGFMSILSEKFTKAFEHRIINVHPSLIPSFCGKGFYGLRVHEAALSYGVKVTGATVHYVNEIPDGGEIIMQKAVKIKKDDTAEILQKRVMQEAEWKILPRATENVCKKLIKAKGIV